MTRLYRRGLVVTAVLLFFFLALDSMVADSPTMDEQNHIARGLALLRAGDPRLSLEHPPLVNILSALPLLTLPELRLPTDDPSWTQEEPAGLNWYFFADKLLWEYNRDVTRMVFLARLPIVYLLLFLAVVGFRFARILWRSWWAGFLAFFLLLFEPNLLAHGRYATTDLGGTLFIFLTAYLLWRLWASLSWNWRRWVWFALALGLAFSSKLSTLVFVPIFAFLAFLPLYGRQAGYGRSLFRRLGQLFLAGLVSLAIIWAAYNFQWGAFRFQSDGLRPFNRLSGPMPTYWAGVEQIALLSGGGRPSFLLGQFSNTGFTAYFPVAFLVKTPLAILIALPVAAVALIWQPDTRKKALYLLVPALLYFVISMQSGLNIGYRHLLPLLPFLLTLIAGLPALTPHASRLTPHATRIIAGVTAVFLLLATLSIHPHYLSFFNAAAGGPANGANILIDSNIDWGQDLIRLRQWMAENDVESVKLGWFGTARPEYYGIQYQPLPGLGGVGQPAFFDAWWDAPFDPAQPEPGVYAISATSLGEFPLQDKTVYAWFRQREPDARIGYSILIYTVGTTD
ncbi:MAG TPA: phospholipid carrier-dependent glycosyltransferase [Chloroflexi bacterium]|nr:phospholipid carrier-dependent glycosyltransferase [Chloroflexota bacterium]